MKEYNGPGEYRFGEFKVERAEYCKMCPDFKPRMKGLFTVVCKHRARCERVYQHVTNNEKGES